MEAISIIITVILLALLVLALIKKFNILAVLTFLTFIGLLAATILNGTSVLGQSSCGNMWLDIFEQWRATFASVLSSTGLLLMTVMGFAGYMNHIKASDMFAGLVAIPVSKIKVKAILIGICPLLGLFFQTIIPSGMSAFVVALSTIYPIMVAVGINPVTVAIGLLFGCNVFVGPANPIVALALTQLGLSINVADFFFQYTLVVVIILEICFGIIIAIWCGICDKKDGDIAAGEVKSLDINSLGIPKWYALFPILPLVFIIIFSSFATGGKYGVISVPGAYMLTLCIAVLLHVLASKKGTKKDAFDETGPLFYDAMGNAFAKVASIVALGTFFAAALNALGGITAAVNILVNGLGLGFVPMLIICLIIYWLMSLLGGPTLPIPILLPLLAQVAALTGDQEHLYTAAVILTLGGGLGLMLQPFDPKVLMIAQIHEVEVGVVLKRNLVPAVIGAIIVTILAIVLYGL